MRGLIRFGLAGRRFARSGSGPVAGSSRETAGHSCETRLAPTRPGTAPAGLVTAGGFVVALRPLAPDAPWTAAWRALHRRPFVENLFYGPDFALAAAADGVVVALVGDRSPEEPGLRLHAVWPVRPLGRRWGVPLRLTMGWMHDLGVFGAPLLDADAPGPALDALLLGLRTLAGRRLMLTHVPTGGAFAGLLTDTLARGGLRSARFWEHERAFLAPSGASPAERAGYLGHLSARRRRRLRQARERMGEAGPLVFETVRAPEALAAALDDYVALESRGWKGRAGTAIGRAPAQLALIRAAVAAFAPEGHARIDRLRRDGHTLAAAVGFVTGGQFWCLKIAFDEEAARDTPGAELLHRLTRDLLADPAIRTADSCAPPGFRLAETFWAERLRLAHVLVEAPGGDPLFRLAVGLERARAWASRRFGRGRRPHA